MEGKQMKKKKTEQFMRIAHAIKEQLIREFPIEGWNVDFVAGRMAILFQEMLEKEKPIKD